MRAFDKSGSLVAGRDFPTYVDGICGHRHHYTQQIVAFNQPCGGIDAANYGGDAPQNDNFRFGALFKINLSEPKCVDKLTVSIGGSLNSEGWFVINDIIFC